jgi:phage-related protein
MSHPTYHHALHKLRKPLLWLHGEVKTPPFSFQARIEAGVLIRQLQECAKLSLPHSRPMPVIGRACHELRIQDQNRTWRIVYYVDTSAIVILDVFAKTTSQTPPAVIDVCKARLKRYKSISQEVVP